MKWLSLNSFKKLRFFVGFFWKTLNIGLENFFCYVFDRSQVNARKNENTENDKVAFLTARSFVKQMLEWLQFATTLLFIALIKTNTWYFWNWKILAKQNTFLKKFHKQKKGHNFLVNGHRNSNFQQRFQFKKLSRNRHPCYISIHLIRLNFAENL